MFRADLKLEGQDELVNTLTELDKAVRGRISTEAVAVAVAVFVEPIRQRAPRMSGELADSVGSRVRYYPRRGVVAAYAGPSYPRGAHGSILEHGTVQRQTRKGYFRGSGPAMPFVGPAFASAAGAAESILERELKQRIEAEVGA